MPLPAHLHEILTQAYPELILLEPEQLRQLEAYLEAPDRFHTKLSQVQKERRQGRDDHLQAKHQHEEFHRYLKRVAVYNRNESSNESNIPSAATEGRFGQITKSEDDLTIEGASRCAVGILRSLETLKQFADERRPPRAVEETFNKLCSDLRGLDLAISKRKIGDAFIQARLPVDGSSNAHGETRSWHHAVWAIGLDWYQQIFKVVDGALFLQLRMTQPTGFRFDELPGSRVADGWRPDETFDGAFELRPGDRDPTANVEGRLQGMPRPDFDHLLMMLDTERAIATGKPESANTTASDQSEEAVDAPVLEQTSSTRNWPDPESHTTAKVWTLKNGAIRMSTKTDGEQDGTVEFAPLASGASTNQMKFLQLLCFKFPQNVSLEDVLRQVYPDDFAAMTSDAEMLKKALRNLRSLVSDVRMKKLAKAGLNPDILPPLSIEASLSDGISLKLAHLHRLDDSDLDKSDAAPF